MQKRRGKKIKEKKKGEQNWKGQGRGMSKIRRRERRHTELGVEKGKKEQIRLEEKGEKKKKKNVACDCAE